MQAARTTGTGGDEHQEPTCLLAVVGLDLLEVRSSAASRMRSRQAGCAPGAEARR
jgi:hypothetical protein